MGFNQLLKTSEIDHIKKKKKKQTCPAKAELKPGDLDFGVPAQLKCNLVENNFVALENDTLLVV